MKQLLVLLLPLLSASCSTSPVPIAYGKDICAHCGMIISDPRFGAELVTSKGKIFKFDSVECLLNEVGEKGEEHYAHILVTDFTQPEKFIEATSAAYLISDRISSPMGANLSAYRTHEAATTMLATGMGEILYWDLLQSRL